MRRATAIIAVLALLAGPVALYAAAREMACAGRYCMMMHCVVRGQCMMTAQEHSPCAGTAIGCDCMRYPRFSFLAPSTKMILPGPVWGPGIERAGTPQAAANGAPPLGLLPATFHPPRG